jgi:hypothetical protein
LVCKRATYVSVANKGALDLRAHVESSFLTKIWKPPLPLMSFLWSISGNVLFSCDGYIVTLRKIPLLPVQHDIGYCKTVFNHCCLTTNYLAVERMAGLRRNHLNYRDYCVCHMILHLRTAYVAHMTYLYAPHDSHNNRNNFSNQN